MAADAGKGFRPYKLSVTQISTQSTAIDNSATELQRSSLLLNAGANLPLNKQWSVGVRGGYDRLDYDWRNLSVTDGNYNSPLFADSGETWDQIERYRLSAALNYRMDKHWSFMLAPQLQYAFADTASMGDSQSYGVVASAMYAFDSSNMLGLGIAYLNDIDEVRTLPYLALRWQINERWKLANPFQAGFSGPAGLELTYQLNPLWEFGVGNSRRTERFLVSRDNIVVETNEWVSYFRAGWQLTPVIGVNMYAGYYFAGEIEITHQATMDMDNQGAAALDIEFRF
ncbi:DUF6268 family outer membrane beta-barrel protein [Shewanella acanthi]|uniref:DUF6268 family outer membrane beta-barrel protein n=1 Tax=Shewanella acanthi TaxID=2864212 RepID=UPI001C661861|nr:DUF6268 family outer membrane beta-barrel protein [Shewanella acanthi]QYJ80549.1 autotransporter outer membrane beta-barrel domain-containing protein [Shewanella acanthi]